MRYDIKGQNSVVVNVQLNKQKKHKTSQTDTQSPSIASTRVLLTLAFARLKTNSYTMSVVGAVRFGGTDLEVRYRFRNSGLWCLRARVSLAKGLVIIPRAQQS